MKNLTLVSAFIASAVVACMATGYVTKHTPKDKPLLENKVDSVLSYLRENAESVDTFDIYLENIRELGVVGTNTLIIYDDPDAGFDNELMQVVSPEAAKLIFNNMGKDIDSKLIVIMGQRSTMMKVTLLK